MPGNRVWNLWSIKFDVHPEKSGNYNIELNYILYGATWRTYYELRANPSEGKIRITYSGKISQRTGEDWENTKIVLSTGKPALGGPAPTVEPWYIYSYEYEGYERAPAEPAVAAMEVTATKSVIREPVAVPPVQTGIAVWYPLPGRYTIKTGEPEKKVQIYEPVFDADFEYLIIPRLTELAYSTGKFQNEEDKDRGIYYWKITIKPGGSFKITTSFSVEAPETANVEEVLY